MGRIGSGGGGECELETDSGEWVAIMMRMSTIMRFCNLGFVKNV